MNKCKTCKWWKLPDDNDYHGSDICEPTDPDTCKPMKLDFEVKECTSPLLTRFERTVNNNGVSLMDGSQYKSDMYTAENFGCVNHEV